MGVRMAGGYFFDGWEGEMVIVVVGDDYCVDYGNVCYVAGHFCVSFGTDEREWTATVGEDWIEEDAETGRELDVIAGVAEPCCANLVVGILSCWEEGWTAYRNCRWCCIWTVAFACDSATDHSCHYCPR